MKIIFLLSLFLTFRAFAEDDFEKQLRLNAESLEANIESGKKYNNFEKFPNDNYVKVYNAVIRYHSLRELKIYEDSCKKNKTHCLTPAEKLSKENGVKAKIDVLSRRNEQAKANIKAAEERRDRIEFRRLTTIRDCGENGVGCERLSAADRKLAAAIPPSPVVENPAADFAMATVKKMNDQLQVNEDEFAKKHPNWKDQEMTSEIRDFLLKQEDERLKMTVAGFKELCNKFPDGKGNCQTPEQLKNLEVGFSSAKCKIQRKFEIKNINLDHHIDEWEKLPLPKSCKVLLKKDKISQSNNETEKISSFKPETCQWVNDLPRKIIEGPGCGKTRSKICTGHVVCEQKESGVKLIRLSTCGEENCGESDAVECTKELGFTSRYPEDQENRAISNKVKKVLSGASEQ